MWHVLREEEKPMINVDVKIKSRKGGMYLLLATEIGHILVFIRDGIGSVWVRIWHEIGLEPRYCRLSLEPRFPGPGIIRSLFRTGFLV